MNKVILMGRLGADPEMKATQGGVQVARMRLATSVRIKGEEKTEWHTVVTFGKSAEFCGSYLSKGRQVLVEGRLQTRSWEKDGAKQWTTEVVANSVQALGPKPQTTEDEAPGLYGSGQDATADTADDDVPF